MKSFVLAFLFLAGIIECTAQFIEKPIRSRSMPQCMYFYDNQLGFMGGEELLKTTDGGATWTRMVSTGFDTLVLAQATPWAFHFMSPSTGFAAIHSSQTGDGAILRTDNGGATWKYIFRDQLLQEAYYADKGFHDIHFFDANRGLIVGGEGRFVVTTDGGATWTRKDPPVKEDYFDILFLDGQTGFVSGAGVILKTTNGGATWTSTTFTEAVGQIRSLYFTSALNGYASSTNGYVLRTSDGGNTWKAQRVPSIAGRKIVFTDSDHGYVVGKGLNDHNLLKTEDGGNTWEATEQTFPMELTDIRFSDANTAMICGNKYLYYSYLAKTTTGVGRGIPNVAFDMTSSSPNYCPGTVMTFTNEGNRSYQHQWSINDVPVSTDYDLVQTFDQPGSYKVTLTTSHGGLSSVLSKQVFIADPKAVKYNVKLNLPRTVCAGSATYIGISNYYELNGVTFELWADGRKLNTTSYTGQINIPETETAKFTPSTNLTLKCFRSYTCYDESQDIHFNLPRILPLDYKADVELIPGPNICAGQHLRFVVHNSVPEFHYKWYDPKADIRSIYANGNDGDIYLDVPDEYPHGPTMQVTADASCKQYTQTYTIKRSTLTGAFTANRTLMYDTEKLTVANKSKSATQYLWNFGADAQPETFTTATPPQIAYTTTGEKKIQLTVKDGIGCEATQEATLFVAKKFTSLPTSTCSTKGVQQPSGYHAVDAKADGEGNIYRTGYHQQKAYGLSDLFVNAVLTKYAADGSLLWEKQIVAPSKYAGFDSYLGVLPRGIAVDSENNLYWAFDFDIQYVQLDGRDIGAWANDGSHDGRHSAIVKISPEGNIIWHALAYDTERFNKGDVVVTDIEIDAADNVYFNMVSDQWTNNKKMAYRAPDQQVYSFTPTTEVGVGENYLVKIDKNGKPLAHHLYGGNILFQGTARNNTPWFTYAPGDVHSANLNLDRNSGRVMLTGIYSGSSDIKFGSITLPAREMTLFMATFDQDHWVSAFAGPTFEMPATMAVVSNDDDNQALYLSCHWPGFSLQEEPAMVKVTHAGKTTNVDANGSSMVLKWNYDGTVSWVQFHRNAVFRGFGPSDGSTVKGIGTANTFGIFSATETVATGFRTKGLRDTFAAELNDNTGLALRAFSLGTSLDDYAESLIGNSCGQYLYMAKTPGGTLGEMTLNKISFTGSCSKTPPNVQTAAEVTTCEGNSLQLKASGATSYVWSPPAGLSNPNIANPVATVSETTKYTVRGYSGAQCYSTKTVTVNVIATTQEYEYEMQGLFGHFFTPYEDGSTYSWDFGDGGQGSSENWGHTYATSGTYEVCLNVTNTCGNHQICKTITVHCLDPEPGFIATVYSGLTVNFSNYTVGVTEWHWNFGDGANATTQSPSHTFSAKGTYDVCLKATNDCSTETVCQQVSVGCTVPTAPFTLTADDRSVTATARGADDNEYTWAFGDGTTLSGKTVTHIYQNTGTQQVCLTVKNPCGETQDCKSITLSCKKPAQPAFTIQTTDLKATFQNTSTNATSYSWDFGDGTNASSLQQPVHEYAGGGTYTVCLKAIGNCDERSLCKTVTIQAPCTPPPADFTFVIEGNKVTVTRKTSDAEQITWDFGDGPTLSTKSNPVSYVYTTPGTYSVCLYERNSCGEKTQCYPVKVECADPIAAFTTSIQGLDVTLVNISTDATSWEWKFGPSGKSIEKNPVFTFQTEGTYTVCLTAYNACKKPSTVCQELELLTTNIAAEAGLNSISITPNPFQQSITIHCNNPQKINGVTIFTTQGQQVYRAAWPSSAQDLTADLPDLAAGVYFVQVSYADRVMTQRLIKTAP